MSAYLKSLDDFRLEGKASPLPALIPGNTYAVNSSTQDSCTDTFYVKLKEIKMLRDGIVRVSYEAMTSNESYQTNARIYVNGSPKGIERSIISAVGFVAYTEDIAVKKNDLVQLYAKLTNYSTYLNVKNFKIGIEVSGDYATVIK